MVVLKINVQLLYSKLGMASDCIIQWNLSVADSLRTAKRVLISGGVHILVICIDFLVVL